MRAVGQGRAAPRARRMPYPRDSQYGAEIPTSAVALRPGTVPARDPAIAEIKRCPRCQVAVDGLGDRHALRTEDDEDKKRAHQVPDGGGQRGSKDRYTYTYVYRKENRVVVVSAADSAAQRRR